MSSVFDRLTEPKEMADSHQDNDAIPSESVVVDSHITASPAEETQSEEAQSQDAQRETIQGEDAQDEEPQATALSTAAAPGSSSAAVQYTARDIKEVSQELLRYGLLDAESKLKLYQTAVTHHKAIKDILEPFDLTLRIDDVRGLAYVVVSEGIATDGDDEWSHPLIRKQRLNMEQSLLLAILRELYVAHELEHGVGSTNAVIPVEELTPRLRIYLGEMGSDSAEEKRTRNLLEKLKSHGVVSEVDKYNQVTVRPIITHLANPENLSRLLDLMKKKAGLAVEEPVETVEEGAAEETGLDQAQLTNSEQSPVAANNETQDQGITDPDTDTHSDIEKTAVEVNP